MTRRSANEIPPQLLRLIDPGREHAVEEPARTGRLPWLRDPMIQLTLATATFTAAIGAALAVPSPWSLALAIVALASAFLASLVLLRSVRHGWNVQSYGWARKATRRAEKFRLESDALWSACNDLAKLTTDERSGSSDHEILRTLFSNVHRAISRSSAGTSMVLVEEKDGRFLVVCADGNVRGKPHYVAPHKSCVVDRAFPDLLMTFAPNGSTAADEVRVGGHRYWIGITSSDPEIPGASQILAGLSSWVTVADFVGRTSEEARRVHAG